MTGFPPLALSHLTILFVAITQPFPEFFGCALISRKGNLFYVCVGLVAFVDAGIYPTTPTILH